MNAATDIIELAGTIALLLWGVHMVQTGLQRAFGPHLRAALGEALSNRAKAFLTGMGVTAILQSSTAVGLMVAGFVAHGLVDLVPALAVMLGANVGTTLIVQVLSFDIAKLAPALVLAGVLLFRGSHASRWHDLGRVAIGLGLILMALHQLLELLTAIENTSGLQTIMRTIAGQPVIGLIIAALLTWLAHSSVAVVLLIMSLASRGVLPVDASLAFVLGANLGTALNPWFEAGRGDNPANRRLPLGNLLNRTVGIAIALPLLPLIGQGMQSLETDPGRIVADFHTIFNVVLALLFLPFLAPFAALLQHWLPDRADQADISQPRYLDAAAREAPVVALANASREALRMVDVLHAMLSATREVLEKGELRKAKEVKQYDDAIDKLNTAIKDYLTTLDPDSLSEADRRRASEILTFITNIEHAGDVVEQSLLRIASKRLKRGLKLSAEGFSEISDMMERLMWNLQAAGAVFMTEDPGAARALAGEKATFRDMEDSTTESHFERLQAGLSATQATTSLHLDLVRDIKLVNAHLVAAAAYPMLKTRGELLASRMAGNG